MTTQEQCNRRHRWFYGVCIIIVGALITWCGANAIAAQKAQTGVAVLEAQLTDIQRRLIRIEDGVDELNAARGRE